MIRHIVFWKFLDEADGCSKEQNLSLAKSKLESLKDQIPQILEFEVGMDITHLPVSFDLALNSVFRDPASLAAYQAHPAHVRVAEYLRKVQSSRVVTDYRIGEP